MQDPVGSDWIFGIKKDAISTKLLGCPWKGL